MTSWQPIETAPRDETPILAYDGTDITTVCGSEVLGRVSWELSVGMISDPGDSWPIERDFYPTHWMPLPDLPGGSASELSFADEAADEARHKLAVEEFDYEGRADGR